MKPLALPLIITILALGSLSACGVKGPLTHPGDTKQSSSKE